MRLYNTLTRRKQSLSKSRKLKMYQCGPTVYWVQHIGNLRAMVMADLIVRSLKYCGHDVLFVRNYTDVGHLTSDGDEGEDKMEKGARREGMSTKEIADKYIAQFESDVSKLNTLRPDITPKATDHIDEMINIISALFKNGHAYATDLAVYYDVSTFSSYTDLSKQKIEDLSPGSGKGDVLDSQKRNPADFALWFFKTGQHANALQYWKSPFKSPKVQDGEGFPGWHIECSAMSMKYLGPTLDIHMGGVEHIPVHHTNEIAQSEGATGKQFAKIWIHNEHLLVENSKMAKSKGSGITLFDIEKRGYHPLSLRFFFLQAHYRSQQNFTFVALEASQRALETLLAEMFILFQRSKGKKGKVIKKWKNKFVKVLGDDINIPRALAVVWDMINDHSSAPEDVVATAVDFDKVLGLSIDKITKISIPVFIDKLRVKREELRQDHKYEDADKIRGDVEDHGFEVIDARQGSFVKPANILKLF